MSGCNCKTNKNIDDYLNDSSISEEKVLPKIGSYMLKTMAFILMLIALPIIILFIIWFMFRTIVLTKEVNIKPLLLAIGKKFQDKDIEEEDDEDDEITEDDVIMLDVEDITKKDK